MYILQISLCHLDKAWGPCKGRTSVTDYGTPCANYTYHAFDQQGYIEFEANQSQKLDVASVKNLAFAAQFRHVPRILYMWYVTYET